MGTTSGAGRTGGRSCSSTAGPRAISAGPSSTGAPWLRSSGWSPVTCAATGCRRRPPNRALHRGPALGRRPGRDHRPARPGPAGAGRLVLRWIHHLRLPARPRQGPDRRHRLRRRGHDAGRGGVRDADRPGLLRQRPRRHRRRPADQLDARTSFRAPDPLVVNGRGLGPDEHVADPAAMAVRPLASQPRHLALNNAERSLERARLVAHPATAGPPRGAASARCPRWPAAMSLQR
jgi:hypothetical protein